MSPWKRNTEAGGKEFDPLCSAGVSVSYVAREHQALLRDVEIVCKIFI